MFSNTHLFRPKPSPIKKKTPFIIAIRDIKTNNIAPTLTAILTPSAVPEESAPIKLLPILSNKPTAKLEIASHTDSRGTDESNQLLSERIAQAVVNYLQERKINSSLLEANGYGDKRLKKNVLMAFHVQSVSIQ